MIEICSSYDPRMIDDRRSKKTMDQVLAHAEALIGQRLGLTAKVPQPAPDPEALAAAHAAGGEGNAQAWMAGWNARVNGGSLDEVAKKWPGDLGLQADAILGWRKAEKHLPVRQRVSHWSLVIGHWSRRT